MKELKVYCVFDTLKQEFWISRNGYNTWHLSSAAKNAWNLYHPFQEEFPEGYIKDSCGYDRKVNFNKQTRYIIKEFILKAD